jgi:hypothetical protein
MIHRFSTAALMDEAARELAPGATSIRGWWRTVACHSSRPTTAWR